MANDKRRPEEMQEQDLRQVAQPAATSAPPPVPPTVEALGVDSANNTERNAAVTSHDFASSVAQEDPPGRNGPIGTEEVQRAEQILQKYKQGKAALERRIIDNEQWYKLRHWEQIGHSRNANDPEPTSAWLLNSIANKHADAMDNFPQPTVLPREPGDEEAARVLSSVLPVVLEQNQYEQAYSDMWWYKLKTGTGVTGVFWNPDKNNGLGDIEIRELDILNLFWEPGITDIQRSRHFFHIDMVDNDIARETWPWIADGLTSPTVDVAKYIYDDDVDTSEKSVVVDWYYKIHRNGRDVLHYCKFCNGAVLYATENDPEYAERGFYDHGQYPVVFDTLFPEAGSPVGFGYIDVCKSPQIYIDKLDQVIIKHSIMAARPRFFVRGDGIVNEKEYADWTKDFVHFAGSGAPTDNIFPIQINALPPMCVGVRNMKVDELKETSGNRDFSQGGTAAGVTAASAIAALQEAGSKLSRDIVKSAYRATSQVARLCLELMRQFYQEARYFRIVGENGETQFAQFSNAQIAPQSQGVDFGLDMGSRLPIFDIKISAQKASPFSTVAQNERAKELYGMGFFRPDLADQALAALDMMQFDGIESVREKISANGTLYQQVQQLQQVVQQMAMIIDTQNGTALTQGAVDMAAATGMGTPNSGGGAEPEANAVGRAYTESAGSTAGAARKRAASASTPR